MFATRLGPRLGLGGSPVKAAQRTNVRRGLFRERFLGLGARGMSARLKGEGCDAISPPLPPRECAQLSAREPRLLGLRAHVRAVGADVRHEAGRYVVAYYRKSGKMVEDTWCG